MVEAKRIVRPEMDMLGQNTVGYDGNACEVAIRGYGDNPKQLIIGATDTISAQMSEAGQDSSPKILALPLEGQNKFVHESYGGAEYGAILVEGAATPILIPCSPDQWGWIMAWINPPQAQLVNSARG